MTKLADLLEIKVPKRQTRETLQSLRDAFGELSPEFGKIYNSKGFIDKKTGLSFKTYGDLKNYLIKLGIPSDAQDKYFGIVIENWYENVTRIPEYSDPTTTSIPEPTQVDSNTLNKDQLESLQVDADKRAEQIKQTVENSKKEVERATNRTAQIIKEQKAIQEKLSQAKSVQAEIEKIAPIYVEIQSSQQVKFTEEEVKVFKEYQEEASAHPDETKIKLAREIHSRSDGFLKAQGLENEEIEIVVNHTADKIVNNLVESSSPTYIPPTAQLAINQAVFEKIPTKISAPVQEVIKTSISTNSVYRFQPDVFIRSIAKNTLGENVATAVFGADPRSYTVTVTAVPGPKSIPYNFAAANQSSIGILSDQNMTLESIKSLGENETKKFFVDRSVNYFQSSTIGKKILSNSKAEVVFYSVFNNASKTVTFTGNNFVGNAMLRYAPQYAPIINTLTGTKFITPIVSSAGGAAAGVGIAAQTAATATTIATTGGIMASEAFLGGAATAAASTATGAAVGATLGSWLPIIGTAIGATIGALFSKIKEKLPKIKSWISDNGPLLLGAGGLVFFGPAAGAGLLVGGLILTGGLSRAFITAYSTIRILLQAFIPAIATPFIIVLLSLPPLVALIMLVINSGAYIVPPSPLTLQLSQDNPYMEVTKKPDTTKIANPRGTSTVVTYTVTISALKNALTNVKITSTKCSVVKKDKSKKNCPPEIIEPLEDGLSVSPASPVTFSFEVAYDASFSDSLVYDSIEVTADTVEQSGITDTGSATVCVGDCPTDCVTVDDPSWASNTSAQANLSSAIASLGSGHQEFMSKVCADGKEVKLCYTTSNPSPIGKEGLCNQAIYARHMHGDCDINFNQCGIKTESNAAFLLTHELTHHVQEINGSSINEYKNSGAFFELQGRGFCSYSATQSDVYEAMAEANGLFVSIPSWGTCAANYKSLYPKNFIFAQKFMGQ